ncbi:hypothetical protein P7C71_g5962, partial [Lecanoromycetidae sp. Uapishka_2]
MSAPREGPNPLRPYYIPPSVGHATDASHQATSTASLGSKNASTSTNSFGSSARNILADMDYSEYISDSSPSPMAMMKGLVEQAIWKYTRVKLPIETVLRRGQMDIARSTSKGKEMQTVVEVGSYKGLFGTMHSIIYEEGERGVPTELVKGTSGAPAVKAGKLGHDRKKRKGQGFEGLWRGWRVGMWGLVGVWGAATLGGAGAKGGEF